MKSFRQIKEEMSTLDKKRAEAQQSADDRLDREEQRKNAAMKDQEMERQEKQKEMNDSDMEERIADRVIDKLRKGK